MKVITQNELLTLVSDMGCADVTIVTSTEPKIKQRSVFQGRIKRVAARKGRVGISYEHAVNTQRALEGREDAGDFVSLALWGGAGVMLNKNVAVHAPTGKKYVVLFPDLGAGNMPEIESEMWLLDSRKVDKSEINEYLVKTAGSARQKTLQPIYWRVIALENITSLVHEGETYYVEG